MANLIIQENNVERTLPAVHGEEITIKAPCNCSAVTGVQIAGVVYPFYDAAGKPMEMGSGLFSKDNLIRVLIDTENTRATIINHAITPDTIAAAWRDHTHDGSHIVSGLADLATRMGASRIATGTYLGTGTYGASNPTSIVVGFKPKILFIQESYTKISGSTTTSNVQMKAYDAFFVTSNVNEFKTASVSGSGTKITWGDSITSWYMESAVKGQFNSENYYYSWVAIG